ncbi:tryptophan synthase subunit alpha [Clostridiales bacterium PH28_bin88]|nr:tryptophan synthase subunit alpha [Clostridiales bacterium PH28_bin88]
MMEKPGGNRIDHKFKVLKERGEQALIVYVMAGDPDLETTSRLVLELERQGVDLIELGVPFSDPVADGPEIQAAGQRSLASGTTLRRVLGLVGDLRRHTEIPLLLMTYYNPLLRYGLERFAEDSSAAGVDGIIVPDLPMEESGPLGNALQDREVALVPLVAPTTPRERVTRLAASGGGFIYCVSRTGVTGTAGRVEDGLAGYLESIRQCTDRPLAVGFGISGPEHAAQAARYADGVIVGSAVVRLAASYDGYPAGRIAEVGRFVGGIKQALRAT